ncbi:MAG: GNAT family N-acetyltransferase [Candidatus Krumholzibacteriota bacterium]|nr:GNAT family N-acetyltransferase [Candidatus Krumholzibacteriota bacterium]
MMKFEIEVFGSPEEAGETWREFQEKGELYVFQSWEWQKNLRGSSGRFGSQETCVVSVRWADGSPFILLPFGISKRRGLRVLEWLGGDFTDYGAPLISGTLPDESADRDFQILWKEILDRLPPVDLVWLKKMPRLVGETVNPLISLGCDDYHTKGYFTRLPGDWEGFLEAHAGPKTRSTARRKARLLEKMGPVRFEVTGGSQRRLFGEISKAMVAQKRTRYGDIGAPDFLADRASRRIFTDPDPALLDSGMLNVSCLYLDDRIITAHWGMVFRGRFYYFMPSFAQGPWARLSPGELLLTELIRWSIENGLEIFDLTIGDEEYKERWCDFSLDLLQYFEPRSARGKIAKTGYLFYRLAIKNPILLQKARKVRKFIRRFKRSRSG